MLHDRDTVTLLKMFHSLNLYFCSQRNYSLHTHVAQFLLFSSCSLGLSSPPATLHLGKFHLSLLVAFQPLVNGYLEQLSTSIKSDLQRCFVMETWLPCKCVCSLTHPLTHSRTNSPTHSPTHTRSLAHPLTNSLTYSLTHSSSPYGDWELTHFTQTHTHPLIHSLTRCTHKDAPNLTAPTLTITQLRIHYFTYSTLHTHPLTQPR